jgi:hypothetical protein
MKFTFTATSSRPAEGFNTTRQGILDAALALEAPADLVATPGRPVKQMALIEQRNEKDPSEFDVMYSVRYMSVRVHCTSCHT